MEILSNLFSYILLENEIRFLLESDTNSEKRKNSLGKVVAMGEYLKPGANASEGEIENGYHLVMRMIEKYNFTKQELVSAGLRREAFLYYFGNREIRELKKEMDSTTDVSVINSIKEKILKIKEELKTEVNKYYPNKSDYSNSSNSSSSRGYSNSSRNRSSYNDWSNDWYRQRYEREQERKRQEQEKQKREKAKKETTYDDLIKNYKLLELYINDSNFLKKVLYVVENTKNYDDYFILNLLTKKSEYAVSPKIAYLMVLNNKNLIKDNMYGQYLIKAIKLSRQLKNDLISKYPELKKFF